MLEFEESGSATPIDIEEEEENGLDDDFFNIEERNGEEEGEKKAAALSIKAKEWVQPVRGRRGGEKEDK